MEALQQLADIISSFEASYEASQGESVEAEFAPILAAAVDPLVQVIQRSSEALNPTSPSRWGGIHPAVFYSTLKRYVARTS